MARQLFDLTRISEYGVHRSIQYKFSSPLNFPKGPYRVNKVFLREGQSLVDGSPSFLVGTGFLGWSNHQRFSLQYPGIVEKIFIAPGDKIFDGAPVYSLLHTTVTTGFTTYVTEAQMNGKAHGKVSKVHVSVGDYLPEGTGYAVVNIGNEERYLTANKAGVVSAVYLREGDNVAPGFFGIALDTSPSSNNPPGVYGVLEEHSIVDGEPPILVLASNGSFDPGPGYEWRIPKGTRIHYDGEYCQAVTPKGEIYTRTPHFYVNIELADGESNIDHIEVVWYSYPGSASISWQPPTGDQPGFIHPDKNIPKEQIHEIVSAFREIMADQKYHHNAIDSEQLLRDVDTYLGQPLPSADIPRRSFITVTQDVVFPYDNQMISLPAGSGYEVKERGIRVETGEVVALGIFDTRLPNDYKFGCMDEHIWRRLLEDGKIEIESVLSD